LKKHTVINKKYVKAYQNQPKLRVKPLYLIGCVYYGRNRSNHLKLGLLTLLGDKMSTIKLKDGKSVRVKSNTLKSAQTGK
jgi:hypothetical protein